MKKRNILLIAILFFALCTYVLVYIHHIEVGRKVLTVAFLNIGQGDAIFIEAPNGNQVLLDAGKNTEILQQLSGVMHFYDRTLDVVAYTHPDLDHVGGIPLVLERYKVEKIMYPTISATSSIIELIRNLEKNEGAEIIYPKQTDRFILDSQKNIYFDVLWPNPNIKAKDTNDSSMIIRLVYGETEFMLTGDASKAIEQNVLDAYGTQIESDVLKAGHHGSKTSTDQEFVSAIKPRYTIISAGKDNSYGHPHADTIATLKSASTTILYTWDGPVIFTSDGKGIIKK